MQHNTAPFTPRQAPVATGGPQAGGVARREPHAPGAPVAPDGAPPTGNTGVLVSEHTGELSLSPHDLGFSSQPKVDWLAFTVHETRELGLMRLIDLFLGYLKGGQILPHGSMGYSSAYAVLGTGRLMFNVSRPDMGVHVELPAAALQIFAQLYPEAETDALYTLICQVKGYYGKFTRVDIACDTDEIPMQQIEEACTGGHLVSRLRTVTQVRSLVGPGNTIYIGAASSERRVRFYDKAAEQKLQGYQWLRCELQCRKGAAEAAIKLIMQEGASLESLIADVVDFRFNDGRQTNRRLLFVWWASWLGRFRRGLDWGLQKTVTTAERAYDWIINQVAPTLAFLRLYLGDSVWMLDAAIAAQDRIPGHRKSFLLLST